MSGGAAARFVVREKGWLKKRDHLEVNVNDLAELAHCVGVSMTLGCLIPRLLVVVEKNVKDGLHKKTLESTNVPTTLIVIRNETDIIGICKSLGDLAGYFIQGDVQKGYDIVKNELLYISIRIIEGAQSIEAKKSGVQAFEILSTHLNSKDRNTHVVPLLITFVNDNRSDAYSLKLSASYLLCSLAHTFSHVNVNSFILPQIRCLIEDSDPQTKIAIAQKYPNLCSAIQTPHILDSFAKLASDPSPVVRRCSMFTILNLTNHLPPSLQPNLFPIIQNSLRDPHKYVRTVGRQVIGPWLVITEGKVKRVELIFEFLKGLDFDDGDILEGEKVEKSSLYYEILEYGRESGSSSDQNSHVFCVNDESEDDVLWDCDLPFPLLCDSNELHPFLLEAPLPVCEIVQNESSLCCSYSLSAIMALLGPIECWPLLKKPFLHCVYHSDASVRRCIASSFHVIVKTLIGLNPPIGYEGLEDLTRCYPQDNNDIININNDTTSVDNNNNNNNDSISTDNNNNNNDSISTDKNVPLKPLEPNPEKKHFFHDDSQPLEPPKYPLLTKLVYLSRLSRIEYALDALLCDESEENRVLLLSSISKTLKHFPRRLVKKYVEILVEIQGCSGRLWRVRMSIALQLASFSATLCEPSYNRDNLFSLFIKLCQDPVAKVRKTAVQSFVTLIAHCCPTLWKFFVEGGKAEEGLGVGKRPFMPEKTRKEAGSRTKPPDVMEIEFLVRLRSNPWLACSNEEEEEEEPENDNDNETSTSNNKGTNTMDIHSHNNNVYTDTEIHQMLAHDENEIFCLSKQHSNPDVTIKEHIKTSIILGKKKNSKIETEENHTDNTDNNNTNNNDSLHYYEDNNNNNNYNNNNNTSIPNFTHGPEVLIIRNILSTFARSNYYGARQTFIELCAELIRDGPQDFFSLYFLRSLVTIAFDRDRNVRWVWAKVCGPLVKAPTGKSASDAYMVRSAKNLTNDEDSQTRQIMRGIMLKSEKELILNDGFELEDLLL